MVRAAAKNHAYVAIVTDPADYADVLNELELNAGGLSSRFPQAARGKSLRTYRGLRCSNIRLVCRDTGYR